jgi:hypothetical protein
VLTNLKLAKLYGKREIAYVWSLYLSIISPFSDKFELHDEVCALAQFKSFGALGSSIPINFADNFYI